MLLCRSLPCTATIFLLSIAGYTWIDIPEIRAALTSQDVPLPSELTDEIVREAFNVADEMLQQESRIDIEKRSYSRDEDSTLSIAGSRHNKFSASKHRSRFMEKIQRRFEIAARFLVRKFGLTPDQIKHSLSNIALNPILDKERMEYCKYLSDFDCKPLSPYRTMDGTCNNIRNPSLGMAPSCFERLVDPDYGDGLSEKRRSQSGGVLPSPRVISNQIHGQITNLIPNVTNMLTMWGQFMSHDSLLAAGTRGLNNEFLSCCPVSDKNHYQCDPILISPDDPFYGKLGVSCLHNVRSAPCCTCSLGPRQQTNQQTAYIDASQIYGVTVNETRTLRTLDGTGMLRCVKSEDSGDLLPPSSGPRNDFCSFQHPNLNCFQAGDLRVNIHPALTAMHILFLREHNYIAGNLKQLNPSWDEETLFQETRRIVGAEMQMITYNEYLPFILGVEVTDAYSLSVRKSGYTRYLRDVRPGMLNEFDTAAFRFGHSMVHGFFSEMTDDPENPASGYWLKDMFLFPFGLYSGQLERLVAGLIRSVPEHVDRHVIEDLTNHLYQSKGNTSGLDLASININRGRDHGIPGYTTFLPICGGPEVTEWVHLESVFPGNVVPLFRNVYESVHDIDLFSGALAERTLMNGVVGPTIACIIATQFYNVKYGDRFYFEHWGQTGSFTKAQLTEIRKVTLAKILCRTSELKQSQPNVFLAPTESNPLRPCSDYAEMDLSHWTGSE